MGFQLPLFGAQKRERRMCFFSLHPREKEKKFSAYTPKALIYFAAKYNLPIVEDVKDLDAFDVVFFSLHCFRDFYLVARMAHHKRRGQEWIAGGNACATPASVGWIMDYVWVGDCRGSFARIIAGERDMPGMYDPRFPDRPVHYVDEDITPEPLTASEIEVSKGCPRRCLFCVHPWRHRYQEAPQEAVEEFIRTRPGKGVGLVSNSGDDVSYDGALADLLTKTGKTNMIVSNSIQGLTEEVVSQRKREMLLGAEGMSERLRWIVNKPISREMLREKIDLCLRHGRQIRTVYQLNLPGEEARDFDELEGDVAFFRERYKAGSWSLPFIPNQPSAHTPFQWVVPQYSIEMFDRVMAFRKSLFGSNKTGLALYSPAPLGPRKWFAQVVAEWLPITPAVAAAVERLPDRASVPEMIDALASRGVRLPPSFLARDRDTVFPWSNVITKGDVPDKWRQFDRMTRKLSSGRFRGE